jgi:hypothetical protein
MTAHTPFDIALGVAPSAVRDIALMPDGAVAVTGFIGGATSFGGIPLSIAGGADIVVAVVEPTGAVRWAKSFGSTGDDDAWGIVADATGNLYVTGEIYGATSFGGAPLVPTVQDAFVASFTPSGSHRWSKSFAGAGGATPDQLGFRIALAPPSDLVVVGRVAGNIDFRNGHTGMSTGAATNAFAVRLRRADGETLWAQRMLGTGRSQAFGVGLDAGGTIYVAGTYEMGAIIDTVPMPNRGGSDVFLVALDGQGNHLGDDNFGGPAEDWAFDLDVVGSTVHVAGFYQLSGAFGLPPARGQSDGFVATLSTAGTPGWTRAFGSPGCDLAFVLAPAAGELLVGGAHAGTIDLGKGPLTAVDQADVVFAALASDGAALDSLDFGGAGDDLITGVAGVRANGVYITGMYGGDLGEPLCTDYPIGSAGFVRRL